MSADPYTTPCRELGDSGKARDGNLKSGLRTCLVGSQHVMGYWSFWNSTVVSPSLAQLSLVQAVGVERMWQEEMETDDQD
jgi:hypothetical protein